LGYYADIERTPKAGLAQVADLFRQEPVAYEQRVRKERPFGIRVSPLRMLLDATATKSEDCFWKGHQVVRRLEEVKRDPKYHDTASLKATGMLLSKDPIKESAFWASKSIETKIDSELITLNELWDTDSGQLLVLPEGDDNGRFIRKIDLPYTMDSSPDPFVDLVFNEDPEGLYPISDIRPWLGQQLEINEVRTALLRHLDRFKRIYLALRGTIKQEDIDKIMSAEDGAALKTKTATEATIVESQSRLRSSEKIDTVDEFHLGIGIKLAEIIAQFAGPDGIPVNFVQSGEMQFGNLPIEALKNLNMLYAFDIRAGSSMPVNKEVLRKQLMEILAIVKGDPLIDYRPILEEIMKTYDLQNLLPRILTPPPEMQTAPLSRQSGGPSGPEALMRGAMAPAEAQARRPGVKVGRVLPMRPISGE